jgi:hypothetical protein
LRFEGSPNLRFEFRSPAKNPLYAPRPSWGLVWYFGLPGVSGTYGQVPDGLLIVFARPGPFRSLARPRGVSAPPILNLPPYQTSTYRDTANFGLGVCPGPRPGPLCMLRMGVRPQCLVILSNTTRAKWAHPLSRLDHAFRAAEASRYLCDVNFRVGFTTLMSQY